MRARERGRVYAVTTERVLDLTGVSAGRPDRKRAIINPTNLIFNLTGMKPWQSADQFEIFALGSWTIASPYYFGWNVLSSPCA